MKIYFRTNGDSIEYSLDEFDKEESYEYSEFDISDNYIKTNTPLLGKENYAIFSAHDELLGDGASNAAQQVVSTIGYNVYIDAKGVHRMTSSTIKIISKLINKNQ